MIYLPIKMDLVCASNPQEGYVSMTASSFDYNLLRELQDTMKVNIDIASRATLSKEVSAIYHDVRFDVQQNAICFKARCKIDNEKCLCAFWRNVVPANIIHQTTIPKISAQEIYKMILYGQGSYI